MSITVLNQQKQVGLVFEQNRNDTKRLIFHVCWHVYGQLDPYNLVFFDFVIYGQAIIQGVP